MMEFAPFQLDTVNQCLWRHRDNGHGERLVLPPKAFAVLRYLVEHPRRLVTEKELLEAVWPKTYVQPEVIKSQLYEIRRALGDNPKAPLYIETLPRRGYQFIAPISEGSTADFATPAKPSHGHLVGRDRALSRLRHDLRTASRGQRQIVFVTGEPGIGKTAMVDELLREAAIEVPGIRIARGQCIEGYGGKEAYYPMLEALGQLCCGSGAPLIVETLAAQAPTWLVQFPALVKREHRETLQREILGATRERMLREIGVALERIAAETPLLLVFEDLQWVDHSTVDLLSALARQRAPTKLMLIATSRLVDMMPPDQPLKALKQELLVHQLCHEVELEPLAEAEVAEYLAAESSNPPKGLAELVHRHSEGNPLFMVAALDHLTQRGLISRENGAWRLRVPLEQIELGVPENLRQMIEAQIERLSAEEQRALEAASVAGAVFSASIGAAAVEAEPEEFEDRCETLSRGHRMVRAAGSQQFPDGSISLRYEFTHALYREVLYQRQSSRRRAKRHLHAGERLEALYAQRPNEAAPELAHHFEQGGDWLRAIKYLQLTADTVGRRFEPRHAAEILEHALDLVQKLPDAYRAEQEIPILERLATIYLASADSRAIQTSETLVSKAAICGLVDVAVSALLKMAWQLLWTNSEQCLMALERALKLSAEHKDPLLHARTVTKWAVCSAFARGWDARYVEDCRDALKVIRQHGNRLMLGSSLTDYSHIQWLASEYRPAYQSAVEGLMATVQESENNPYLNDAFMRHLIVPWSLLFLGEWGRARREFNATVAIMDRNGDYHQAQAYRLYAAWLHCVTMDFAGVLDICEPIVPLLKDVEGYRIDARFGSILIACAEMGRGNFDRAHALFCALRDDLKTLPWTADWYWRALIESALTELWLAKGEFTRARPHAEESLKLALATDESTLRAQALEARARLAIAEGDLKCAQDCLGRALQSIEGFKAPLVQWKVYATASDLQKRLGNSDLSKRHRELSCNAIRKLADSLPADDPLRKTFLSAPPVARVLGNIAAG
jgi:DNA-binding winged helix-turn-helix (wHTH) protein